MHVIITPVTEGKSDKGTYRYQTVGICNRDTDPMPDGKIRHFINQFSPELPPGRHAVDLDGAVYYSTKRQRIELSLKVEALQPVGRSKA